jgi:hypothetical protein
MTDLRKNFLSAKHPFNTVIQRAIVLGMRHQPDSCF